MERNILRYFFPWFVLIGCMGNNEEGFSCYEQGLARNSGSNWVFGVDTTSMFHFATKYPIRIKTGIFNTHLDLINSFESDADSSLLLRSPHYGDSLRLLRIVWFGTKPDGAPAEPGCYKAKFSIQTLQSALGEKDVPSDTKTVVVIEFHFTLSRG